MNDFTRRREDSPAVATANYVERFLRASAVVDEPERRIIADRLRLVSPTLRQWEPWLRRHSVLLPLGAVLLVLGLLDTGASLSHGVPVALSWFGALTLLVTAGHLWLTARQGHLVLIGLYREVENGARLEIAVGLRSPVDPQNDRNAGEANIEKH